jgi:Tol biopolymer transport system component
MLNVYEASFLSEKEYAVAAVEGEGPPRIFLTDSAHQKPAVSIVDSRYPALSPDGRWMAYAHLDHGFWNLWLRDENSGITSRIADVPCNEIQPSWEEDAKTLLYATDCGRSIWFTAIAKRRVIP